jgi:hypothetical protein
MKTLIIVSIGLFLSISGISQTCLPEGITFTIQAEIDSFQVNYPNCTHIEGAVKISGADITNLSGLFAISFIGGNLEIGNYMYGGNPLLISLTGLEGLDSIGGYIFIYENNLLSNLTGLNNISFIGSYLKIQGNNSLTSLTGLEGLSSIEGGDIYIMSNGMLTSLEGLNNLTSIEGDLNIKYNNSLINLTGLNNVSSIGGDLSIDANSLASLTGLENLTSIGGRLGIEDNIALTSLSGLDNIDAGSITNLCIAENYSLSTCEVQCICDYLSNPNGVIDIYSNASGCNNPSEIANNCGVTLSCLPFGNYYFLSQNEIDNFQVNYPNCSQIQGSITINGSDIANLNGLNNISSIGGGILIGTNLDLNCLTGLDSVTSIGGSLLIVYTYLDNLTGLEGLTTVGGRLEIEYNSELTDLNGLENLTSISGYCAIWENDALTNLSGLDNIDAGSITDLHIYSNALLSTCDVQSICDYLASPNGTVEIHGNATGCGSQEEVEDACRVGQDEVGTLESLINIYPNPASTQITIVSTAPINQGLLQIFNMNGIELYNYQITQPKMDIDINNLPDGVYFVRFTSENGVGMFKVVKY